MTWELLEVCAFLEWQLQKVAARWDSQGHPKRCYTLKCGELVELAGQITRQFSSI